MKQIAKHIALSATPVALSDLFDERTATMLLLLTSNVASEGRRSAQHGGVRSTGWLDVGLGQLALCFSSTCLPWLSRTSSSLLYDLSNPTTRSCGLSMPTDLGDPGALMTWP